MKERRSFLKLAAAALPVSAAAMGGVARADDGSVKDLLGAWTTIHSLPFPPGSFREFLVFTVGGGLVETNSFLHTNSNLDFSQFGLPNAVNASDGMGNWERVGPGSIQVAFRKMLFDGRRSYFGDLKARGTLRANAGRLHADWQIWVVDTSDRVLVPFGTATSDGTRTG
jgi:hypothetical protein